MAEKSIRVRVRFNKQVPFSDAVEQTALRALTYAQTYALCVYAPSSKPQEVPGVYLCK